MLEMPLTAELVAQWHPTLNGDLQPNSPKLTPREVTWWFIEKCGHSYPNQIIAQLRSSKCRVCTGKIVVTGVNDLATLRPDIARELHPSKNAFEGSEVTVASSKRAFWSCRTCSYEWQNSVANRTRLNQGCPACAGKVVVKGKNDLATLAPQLAAEWHPAKNGALRPEQVMAQSHKKAWWLGEVCGHPWEASVAHRFNGRGCPVCLGKKVVDGVNDLVTMRPFLAAEWHPTRNGALLPSQVSVSARRKVWWLCARSHAWEAAIYSRSGKDANGCYECTAIGLTSRAEEAVASALAKLGFEIVRNERVLLNGKELDILFPKERLAVEFNGLYWHSEALGKGPTYRREKWKACRAAGINLVQVWEDSWKKDSAAVISDILRLMSPDEKSPSEEAVERVTVDNASGEVAVYEQRGYSIEVEEAPKPYYVHKQRRYREEHLPAGVVAADLPKVWDAGTTTLTKRTELKT